MVGLRWRSCVLGSYNTVPGGAFSAPQPPFQPMSRPQPTIQALDVHRPSPVRGQLEPYDPRTPKGCRYIQTTDTPDELKVLLPPATAVMYEQLLKLETHELGRKPMVSWERIMEIRHLKDRMLRKCQKLAKSNTTLPVARMSATPRGGDTFVFQTFVAPADFRVKEMEKWFREQQKRNNSAMTAVARRPVAAIQAAPGFEMIVVAGPSRQPSKYSMQRSITNPEPSRQKQHTISYKSQPVIQPSRLVQSERGISASIPPDVFSPPPLPVLLLSQRDDYGLGLSAAAEQLNFNTSPTEPEPQPQPQYQSAEAGPSTSPTAPVPETPTLRPSLSRRNSALRELKTVSWADNPGIDLESQFKKYASAAKEAQASGKFDEVRLLYLDQIAGLESLHNQVKEGLDHLREETEHLQRIDEVIRRQRGALDATFQELESKRVLFQEKVQEALTEANEALTRQGLAPKRDLEPIDES